MRWMIVHAVQKKTKFIHSKNTVIQKMRELDDNLSSRF